MILPIIQAPDPRLVTVCRPIKRFEAVGELIGSMIETRIKAKAHALAAPQIGALVRVVVVNPALCHGFKALVNPVIDQRVGPIIEADEGCLSIGAGVPTFKVKRHTTVQVRFLDRHGQERGAIASGFSARMLQHEIDHLDGVLIA